MKIKVGFFGRARDIVGEDKGFVELEVKDNASINDLLEVIAKKVNESFVKKFKEKSVILTVIVDGVPTNDLNIKLKDGSMVAFVPPSQGG